MGAVRGLPGHPHADRHRGRRHRRPTRPDQLPARAGRRDRLGHGGLFPPRIFTRPWPRSCSRSSTRGSSSATAPTRPAPPPPRKPATSPPAKINPASSASPDASRSTASDPAPQAKRKDIGRRSRRLRGLRLRLRSWLAGRLVLVAVAVVVLGWLLLLWLVVLVLAVLGVFVL